MYIAVMRGSFFVGLHRFKNRPPNGFDQVEGEAEQTIQLSRDYTGSVEYLTM